MFKCTSDEDEYFRISHFKFLFIPSSNQIFVGLGGYAVQAKSDIILKVLQARITFKSDQSNAWDWSQTSSSTWHKSRNLVILAESFPFEKIFIEKCFCKLNLVPIRMVVLYISKQDPGFMESIASINVIYSSDLDLCGVVICSLGE